VGSRPVARWTMLIGYELGYEVRLEWYMTVVVFQCRFKLSLLADGQ